MVWAEAGMAAGGLIRGLLSKNSNSAYQTYKLNKKLMDYQYKLERESRQTSFQDTRKDLEGAGYNPMLAVGQQSNYTPVSSGVSAQSSIQEASEMANTMAGVLSTNSAIKRNENLNNTDLITALSNKSHNNADIDWIASKTQGQDLQNSITSATGMAQAVKDLELTGSQIGLNKRTMEKLSSDIVRNQFENLATQSYIESSNSATAAQDLANEREREFQQWLKDHPWQRKIHYFGRSTGSVVRDTATAGVGVALAGKGAKISKAVSSGSYNPPSYFNNGWTRY